MCGGLLCSRGAARAHSLRAKQSERCSLQRLAKRFIARGCALRNCVVSVIAKNLIRGIRSAGTVISYCITLVAADAYPCVSVLFCEIYDFKTLSSVLSARTLVSQAQSCTKQLSLAQVATLNSIFSAFDRLMDRHKVLKIETIGEVRLFACCLLHAFAQIYMVAAGLPVEDPLHAEYLCYLALDMQEKSKEFLFVPEVPLTQRCESHFVGVFGPF